MGGKTIRNSETQIANFQINAATYGLSTSLILGTTRIQGNVIDWYDFTAIPHTDSQKAGKGGTTVENTTYTYTVAVLIGLCEGPIKGVGRIWKDKEVYATPEAFTYANTHEHVSNNRKEDLIRLIKGMSRDSYGLTLFKGEYGQQPWAYTQSKYPEKALPYSGLAYMAGVVDLGNSGGLPQLNFEAMGLLTDTGDNLDVNPASAIDFIIMDEENGVDPRAGSIDATGLERLRKFCVASDLLLSLPLTDTRKAYEIIQDICKATNTINFWSQNRLKLVPQCDERLEKNGVVFEPNITPEYDLDADDFLEMQDGRLVTFEREDNSEAYNHVTIEFINRENSYEVETAEYKIQVDINRRGLRSMPTVEMHYIHSKERAEYVASLLALDSLYGRNKYRFRLGWSHCLLEPGDLLTLTESTCGLNKKPVVITEIEEDEDGMLEVTAKGKPPGIYSPGRYTAHQAERASIDYGIVPGDTTAVVFNPTAELTTNGLEAWTAASGGATWGGCNVWASDTGDSYIRAGMIDAPSRHGVLTANLAAGSAIDTVNALQVQLIGGDQLLSGTEQDALNLNTLCWVDGELIAYRTSTLTGTKKYSLTYLVRGAYNTPITAHSAGSKFVRLDQSLFKYPFDSDRIGKIIYLKFTSVNIYGVAEQLLSDVEAVEHTLTIAKPPNVSSITLDEDTYVLKDGTVLSDIIVAFTEPTYNILQHYNIYYDLNNSGQWQYAGPAQSSGYKIKSLPNTKTVKVKVCTVNKFGQEAIGTISGQYTITGKSDPPPDVTGLTAIQDEYNRANINLKWTPISAEIAPDIKGYEVRIGANWATATKLNADAIVGAQFSHAVTANGTYTFLVKAIDNSGNYSQNAVSKALTVIVVPDSPVNLGATQDQQNRSILVITWDASPGKDIAGYEIRRGNNWDNATYIDTTRETSYRYTIPASGSITIMVRAKTVAGYLSNVANVTVTPMIEAYDVTGFTAVQSMADRTKIRLMWDKPLSLDVSHYEIRKGAGWDTGTVVDSRVTGSFYDTTIATEGEHSYWIKAVTVAGKYSQNAAHIAAVFSLRPSPVSNIQISQDVNDRSVLNITYEATPESDLANYELRVGYVWNTAVKIGETKEFRWTYSPDTTGSVKVMVKALNAAGYYSDEASASLYVTLEPGNVAGFRIFQNGEKLAFVWDKVPDNDVIGYELREGSNFDNGVIVATGITLTQYQITVDTEILRRFHIKAINRSGHFSNSAAAATISVTDLPPKNVIETFDEIALQTGAHSGTVFGASLITFATLPGDFPDYPVTKFSDIGGATVLKLAKTGSVYQSSGTYTCSRKDIGQVITANIASVFQPSILYAAGTTAALEYRLSRDNVTWTDWQPFQPLEATFRYADFRVNLATQNTAMTPEVNQLLIRIDVPDTDIAKTVTVPIGGIAVSYGHTFYELPVVTPTAEGNTGRAVWSSKTKTNVFLQVINSTGTDIGGTVDLRVKGY